VKRELLPCGSNAAYRRAIRNGGKACDACRTAHTRAVREWELVNPERVRPKLPAPPRIRRRDEVLDEWAFLRGQVGFYEFPAKVGMSVPAWERMFQRARVAGDVRAVRTDWKNNSARRTA